MHAQVHTAHSNVTALAPTLTSCLATSLNAYSSSSSSSGPLQMASACFPGCVQLLANIFSLKTAGSDRCNGNGDGGGDGADDGGGGDGSLTAAKGLVSWAAGDSASAAAVSGSSSSSDLAAAVLSNVCGELLSLGEGAPDVHVAVGAAAATTKGGNNPATTTTAAASSADVGNSSSSKISPEFPAVSLQCFQPAYLTAGKAQQQLTLQLQLPAVQGGDADASGQYDGAGCRLVAFQDGEAVIDQEVTLQGSSIR
jgi:hypothetical protein